MQIPSNARSLLERIRRHLFGPANADATPMPAPMWQAVLARYAFLRQLDHGEATRLRALCTRLIASRQINAAGGLRLNAEMIACIAVQACLPVLELGLEVYPRFSEIIVYPAEFIVERDVTDEAGVVHHAVEALAGEAWDGGPIVLSWADVAHAPDHPGHALPYNVVIHEFAHKLDMGNGEVDGIPRMFRTLHGELDERHWHDVLHASLDDFIRRLDAAEASLPRHIDPDSSAADRHFSHLPLDPYAATDAGEFFSVSSETFFVDPQRLRSAWPHWYDLLCRYYLQDPAARASRPVDTTAAAPT